MKHSFSFGCLLYYSYFFCGYPLLGLFAQDKDPVTRRRFYWSNCINSKMLRDKKEEEAEKIEENMSINTDDEILWNDEDPLAGLSSNEALKRLERYGANEIPKQVSPWWRLVLKQFIGPFPLMIEIAAILSAVAQKWVDMGIILFMLFANAIIGLFQEVKSLISIASLQAQMHRKYSVRRDGVYVSVREEELVPGDVIFLKAGDRIPADCFHLKGSGLQVDTSTLTGEPFPRQIPSTKNGETENILWSGCMVKQGEAYCLAVKTGLRTEIGKALKLMQRSTGPVRGTLEKKILEFAHVIIAGSLLVVVALVLVQLLARHEDWKHVVIQALSITIASVPVALPMLIQITMAVGAEAMARQKAIVTRLTALQEIAAMDILCSDKTGTLTTAQISIVPERIVIFDEEFSAKDLMVLAALASNPDNREDPIDNAVLQSLEDLFFNDSEKAGLSQQKDAKELLSMYEVLEFVPYNAMCKRTVARVRTLDGKETFTISKGLLDKVLSTGNDGASGGQWQVENIERVKNEAVRCDVNLSKLGYKTLGLAASQDEGPMRLLGIIPMLDPPRHDTAETIQNLKKLGIRIKIITGDHPNIAKEVAKMVGLGHYFLSRVEMLHLTDDNAKGPLFEEADGFSEVFPADKQDVVRVLQKRGHIVGMTGDGVNDAPALAQASVGISVYGSTDAAKGAAGLVLMESGISAIYHAVLESRKINRRLKTFVIYRMAATVQIVLFISILIFAYKKVLGPLYVILLALFNDITVVTIGFDNAQAGREPQKMTLKSLVIVSGTIGLFQTAQALIFYHFKHHIMSTQGLARTDDVVYCQIAIGICLTVLVCRTDNAFFLSLPGYPQIISTTLGVVLITVLCGFGFIVHKVPWTFIGDIWVYDLLWMFLLDAVKCFMLRVTHSYEKPYKNIFDEANKEEAEAKVVL